MTNYKEFFRRTLVLLQSSIMLIFQTAIFSIYWFTYYSRSFENPFWNRGNTLLVVLYSFLLYIFIRLFGGNRLGFNRVSDVIYTNLLALIFTNIVIYIQISLIARGFRNISPMTWLSIMQITFVVFWSLLNKTIYTRFFPPRKMLMIVGNINSLDLKSKMDINTESFDVVQIVHIEEGLESVKKIINNYREVIISDVTSKMRNEILKYCYHNSIRVFMTPKISDIIIRGSENIHLFDTPLLLANNKGLKLEQRFLKRIFDIFGSIFGIILLAIPFIIIGILIKLGDGGPVFYTQNRLTTNGKVFKILKFRSMKLDSEMDNIARLSQKEDERITTIGKFLRTTHIDELPQIFNILMGDMSMVGPRPERPEIAQTYENSIPEFSYRLKVKAGLTGYAQVYGKYRTTPYDKLKLDLFYIENFSLFRDLNILLLTVKIMFEPEKSEGVEASQITALQDNDIFE